MYCRNCGKVIPDDSSFCQFCGTKVEKNIDENKMQEFSQNQLKEENESNTIEEVENQLREENESNVVEEVKSIKTSTTSNKNGLKIIALIVVIMCVVGCICDFIYMKKNTTEDISESQETVTEENKEEVKEEEMVVEQPTSFNGNSFSIPFYSTSSVNLDSTMLVKAFFEMKGYSLSQDTLTNDLACQNQRASAENVASVLNKYIDSYGIMAIYEVSRYSDESDLNNNLDWILSIIQTNVDDGYPTYFEVNPMYLYGGKDNQDDRYIIVTGYELSNGHISKLLINDPLQGQSIVVSYDSFVNAISKKSNILYIH